MSLYDQLMECVIYEDSTEEYKNRHIILGEFSVELNNKKYTIYNNEEINSNIYYSQIIKNIKYILKNESKIIDQVYNLYKKNYTGDFNKDKNNDYITGFELLKSKSYPGKFNIGIFLSNINQFYTMFYNGKIIEDETYIY